MKTLKEQQDLINAEKLFSITKQRQLLEKEEKMLKDYFKSKITEEGVVSCGQYALVTTTKTRKDLDKEALSNVVNLEDYLVAKSYSQLEIKKI